MQNTAELISEIESVRATTDAPYIAIAVDGSHEQTPQNIMAGVRALALVSSQRPVEPDSPIFQSNPRGVHQTRHIVDEALPLHEGGYFSLIAPFVPAREGDSSLYATGGLRKLVTGEPAGARIAAFRSQQETVVYVGNLETLVTAKNDWARQVLEHCSTAVHRGETDIAEELAFSSLAMLDRTDIALCGIICRLGQLGFDPDRLFGVYKVGEMGIDRGRFAADIARL